MKLYALRDIETKVFIGLVYANSPSEIDRIVDHETNPVHIEYKPISKSGAFWNIDADQAKCEMLHDENEMGLFPDDDMQAHLDDAKTGTKVSWKPVCPGEVPSYAETSEAA